MQKNIHLIPVPKMPERRKYIRFNEVVMNVFVKRNSIVHELIKGEPVEWLNFNRYGLAFACHRRFNINEKVLVDLKTKTLCVNNLVAVIHNARRQNKQFRYGVQFYFGANSYMNSAEMQDMLDTLEQTLE